MSRGICGSFLLLFSFSCSQFVNFLKLKHYYFSDNITIFYSNEDFFTQFILWVKKIVNWEQENESERKMEPQIPRLRVKPQ